MKLSRKKIEQSLNELYLGNLGTVEQSLNLPSTIRGFKITWKSDNEKILSSLGKVSRPTFEKGNQKIRLKAIVKFEEDTIIKIFDVTVLSLPKKRNYISHIKNKFKAVIGSDFYLPKSVILKLDDGHVSVPVIWENGGFVKVNKNKIYKMQGKIDIENTEEGSTDDTYEVKYNIVDLPSKIYAYVYPILDKEKEHIPTKKIKKSNNKYISLEGKNKLVEDYHRMLKYIESFDLDMLLLNFKEAAELNPTGEQMSGWDAPESKLRGHTTGHYLSAISLAYNQSSDKKLLIKGNKIIDELFYIQNKFSDLGKEYEGYLSAYPIDQFIMLEKGYTYPDVWAPYYTQHKILAGLIDSYKYLGSNQALKIAEKNVVWIYNRLSKLKPYELNKIWSTYIAGEFGGINESILNLYEITKNDIYLKTAKLFDNDNLFYPMSLGINTLSGIHANQHIPQVIGALKMFEVTGDPKYYSIADNFWNLVTDNHVYSIGGVGNTEMFQDPNAIGYELSDKNAESCCSYNMLKLTSRLNQYENNIKYPEYFERVLFNHILGNSYDVYGGKTLYFTGLAPCSSKKFEIDDNTCCHGTGLESKFKYTEGIYYESKNSLYINQYISSKISNDRFSVDLSILSSDKSKMKITANLFDENIESLKIRVPKWSNNNYKVEVRNRIIEIKQENGYIILERNILKNQVYIDFQCGLYIEKPRDREELITIHYGPFVLAIKSNIKDFINLEMSEDSVIDNIKQTGPLKFEINEFELEPIYKIINDNYHVYYKVWR